MCWESKSEAVLKYIIAIAAGVVSGLGYGYNTTAGLISRGLAELSRLAVNLEANLRPCPVWRDWVT